MRFGFGKNWEHFVEKQFSDERVAIAQKHLLEFLGLEDLEGRSFLDIGCGSGLHSLAAHRAGARRVVSFDYDEDSVRTTRKLRELAGNPESWTVMQGSVLDEAFMSKLEPADVTYSWGVLHHTGEMWRAIANTCAVVPPGGLLYIALYDYDTVAKGRYAPEFWLEIKKMYNETGRVFRALLVTWYVWDQGLGRRFKRNRIQKLWRRIRGYKGSRGMAYFTDVRDWLGGWPMEFARVPEVEAFCRERAGLERINLSTGEANSEYLFRKPEED